MSEKDGKIKLVHLDNLMHSSVLALSGIITNNLLLKDDAHFQKILHLDLHSYPNYFVYISCIDTVYSRTNLDANVSDLSDSRLII